MSPIHSYLCCSCNYEFDEIQSHDSPKKMDCPRCEGSQAAYRIPALTSTPRGSFGTTPRRGKDKPAEFKFNSEGQGELPGILDEEEK